MANKQEYIERIQMVIRQLHKIDAKHVETVPVREVFQGKTIWRGHVEVFDAIGHAQAKQVYGWSYKDDSGEHFAAILGLPPVSSAHDAVKVSIAAKAKNGKHGH